MYMEWGINGLDKTKRSGTFCGSGGGSTGYYLVRQGTERTRRGNRGYSLGKMRGEILAVIPGPEHKGNTDNSGKKQMKSLISDISHQTKIPLANIKLYQEFLQEEELSEKGRVFLRQMEEQTEKLGFLLQSMVKMSRLENGIIQIKKEQRKLQETLTAAVSQVVPAASRKEISLHVGCEPDLFLKHDRKWTEEAIFNVLDNAVKYTNPKGRIAVQVIHQEIFTKISVRDNGKGILPERQAEIFTRFYREPEVHDNHGVGIGLYLTRKILELQNGYIEVHSETGKGSDFCLYLPNEG